jgi:hypothetical protein
VGEGAHLSTWITKQVKQRFATAAARQGLSESALLKRLVEQMLAAWNDEPTTVAPPADTRDSRVTVRLVADDRALLRERAAARSMAAATYVSYLVRAHLRQLTPLPVLELAALRAAIAQLGLLDNHLAAMLTLMYRDPRQATPGASEVRIMVKVCEALRDHVRGLIRQNVASWSVGYEEQGH